MKNFFQIVVLLSSVNCLEHIAIYKQPKFNPLYLIVLIDFWTYLYYVSNTDMYEISRGEKITHYMFTLNLCTCVN